MNTKNPRQLMTVDEIATLLAPKVAKPDDRSLSYTKAEVKKRILYAIHHGKLSSPNEDNRYELGTVVAWADAKSDWSGKLTGLPRTIIEQVEVRGTLGGLLTGHVAPADLEQAEHAISRMAMELAEERATNLQLNPNATSYERFRARQQSNAKQKRSRDL